jgi:hypothetical protein
MNELWLMFCVIFDTSQKNSSQHPWLGQKVKDLKFIKVEIRSKEKRDHRNKIKELI